MLINAKISPPPPQQPWPRDYTVTLLQAALSVQEYRFVRQTALHWLASYPGDLPIDLMHGQALLGEAHTKQAYKIAWKLCERDPEFLGAQELLEQTQNKLNMGNGAENRGNILALGGATSEKYLRHKRAAKTPAWTSPLREARQALAAKNLPFAATKIQEALAIEADTPLAALTHLRVLAAQEETPRSAVQNLAAHFAKRWPECIQFMLFLADAWIDSGDSGQGVALLHQATASDVTGQVACRLWGEQHPYRDLWPTRLTAVISIPVPARVTAALGWNLLDIPELPPPPPPDESKMGENATTIAAVPKSSMIAKQTRSPGVDKKSDNNISSVASPSKPKELPETLRSIQAELEQVGENLEQPLLARSDGRFPTYVILTTRKGLRNKYGRAGTAMLEAALQELAATVRRQPDWGAFVFIADDPACTTAYDVKPAAANDPWAIKLALADLDAALALKGVMIGSVLIVGGPEVVPFHHLPNPTDDPDTEVPSDNPYATRDENYFIPEWPVGRLPDGAGNNPTYLLRSVQAITAKHAVRQTQPRSLSRQIWRWLRTLWRISRKPTTDSVGFSAEAWRKASLAVYRQIGAPSSLVTSPPINREAQAPTPLDGQLGYFNLHGLADTDEWYGQRDTTNGSSGPDYPVALRVQDMQNGVPAPEIIFSEACYGAHIIEKRIEDSLALKFMEAGNQVFVGSTVMSYGSISTPLNAADLLGIAFWKYLQDGNTAGEALLRAKIHLAREMHKRQGYLDGEDQKTLISFVFFGDPLFMVADLQPSKKPFGQKRSKAAVRPLKPPTQVKTICDRSEAPGRSEPIPEDVMKHVKQVVAQYLPGMQGAQVVLSHEQIDCDSAGHDGPTAQLRQKSRPDMPPERRVVTLSKSIPIEKHLHPTYARLTLDKQGKVVKLAVSR